MDRLRAKEATIELIVNGERKDRAFAHVRNVNIGPTVTTDRKKFIGQKRASNDIAVDGWEATFEMEESNAEWFDVWKLFEDAELNGSAWPVVTMIITKKFRSPGSRWVAAMYGELFMTPGQNAHSEHDHTSVPWNVVAQYVDKN